ncbi:MAG: acyltransferase [Planctomycetes bacterium]|nr:acyltransferase [Planctomycetota bacterium]
MSQSPRRDLLPAVTPLRFPAAFVVFVVHCWMLLKGADPLTFTLPHDHLAAGVQFFFLLSGFILTYNYLHEFRNPTRRAAWNFYVARWARVYPVHVLTALAALPVTLRAVKSGHISDPFTVSAVHLFLLQAFVPVTSPAVNAFNGASWSLSVECCFYLSLPLLIPALVRGGLVRRAVVLLVLLAPWMAAVASVCGAFELPAWMHPYRFPPVRMVDFIAGVLLGVYWHHRNATPAAPVSVRRATVTEVAAIAGLTVWAWACFRVADGKGWLPAVSWIGIYLPPFAVCLWTFARGRGLVSRLIASKTLEYLGEISFAFYMFHIPVIGALLAYGWRFGLHKWSWPAQWACACAATFALAIACYHLYEIPLRDRLRRRLSIKKPKADAPASIPLPVPTEAPAKAA